MKTISQKLFQNLFEIKKSKFITIATQIKSKAELNNFLLKHCDPNARHNCFAYKIGVNQQQGGFNDDGEPSGTAGKQIFNVIDKMNLTNIVVLVIRHFGGIKLGAGPLTRAYRTSASDLLNRIELINLKKTYQINFSFPIAETKKVDAFIRQHNLNVTNRIYNPEPNYTLFCSKPELFVKFFLPITNFIQEEIYIEMD